MGKTLLKGTLWGALIAFVWVMVSWTVLSWHCATLNTFSNEETVASCLIENTEKDGIYILPGFCGEDAHSKEEHYALAKKGPVAFVSIRRGGFNMQSFTPFVISALTQIAGAFLITLLLMQMKGISYLGKVGSAALIGLTIGVVALVPTWNWWHFSILYVLVGICDFVIAWTLAGFVIAAFTHKK